MLIFWLYVFIQIFLACFILMVTLVEAFSKDLIYDTTFLVCPEIINSTKRKNCYVFVTQELQVLIGFPKLFHYSIFLLQMKITYPARKYIVYFPEKYLFEKGKISLIIFPKDKSNNREHIYKEQMCKDHHLIQACPSYCKLFKMY